MKINKKIMSSLLVTSMFLSMPIFSNNVKADVIKEKSTNIQNNNNNFSKQVEKNTFIKKEAELLDNVRKRTEPKDNSKYNGTEDKQSEILVIGEYGDWFKVARNNNEFFVKKEFVKIKKDNIKLIERKEKKDNDSIKNIENESKNKISLANSGTSIKEADAYNETSITNNESNSLSSISNESSNEIMEFNNAVVTGFNDSYLVMGPAQGKNAVAAHNMPYGTIIEIPQLKGQMGGGTFRSSKTGKTYNLGEKNNGRFIVADTGGPFFDFDIWGYTGGKKNMDVKVISWGEGEGMAWSITEAIQDAQRRGTWNKLQRAFNNTNTTYGGFKTKKLSKFKNHDLNNSIIK